MNRRTSRSQPIGDIVGGWGKAAMEVSVVEERLGRFPSTNLSGAAIRRMPTFLPT
jgi:hypothetical protein